MASNATTRGDEMKRNVLLMLAIASAATLQAAEWKVPNWCPIVTAEGAVEYFTKMADREMPRIPTTIMIMGCFSI